MSMENAPKLPANEQWRPTTKEIVAAVIGVVALLFIFQNNKTGHFHFLWFDFSGRVWLWLLFIFGAGLATGLLIASRRSHRKAAPQ